VDGAPDDSMSGSSDPQATAAKARRRSAAKGSRGVALMDRSSLFTWVVVRGVGESSGAVGGAERR
jgi:hypothetical protein